MILIFPITKKNDKIGILFYLFCRKFREITFSYNFLAENRFLPTLCVYFRSCLHYDIIVTSYADGWYLFGINGNRRQLYSGSKHKGIGRLL